MYTRPFRSETEALRLKIMHLLNHLATRATTTTTTMRARPTTSDEAFAAARVAYVRARDPTLAIELFDDALDLLDEEARSRWPSRDDAATTRRRAEALANQA